MDATIVRKPSDTKTDAVGIRPRITIVHATAMIAMGSAFTGNTIAGGLFGKGMYPFLFENHIGAVGLLQAYMLMALIGAAIWIGFRSARPFPRAWHFLAMAAHVPPLLAMALFAATTPEMAPVFIAASLAIHSLGIGAELFAATRKDPLSVGAVGTPEPTGHSSLNDRDWL